MGWKVIPDEFSIDDIGARLLANLAKGIYNHEAVLREYVQNACDAYRVLEALDGGVPDHEAIRIEIEDEKTISIQDNGIGMDLSDVKKAKRIAVSNKTDADDMIGFRGIGIWAGFQACETLELVTTKKGNENRYKLEINFSEILKHVDENINIKQLLDGRFHIREEKAAADEHYTHVRLRGLLGDYRHLGQQEEVQRIVSQTLPCKIDPTFIFKVQLEAFLDGLVGYEEYSILVDGGEVYKSFPNNVKTFNTTDLVRDNEEIGKVWWATGTKSLITDDRQFQYRKFRLRVRNFAVGGFGIYGEENASGLGIVDMQD